MQYSTRLSMINNRPPYITIRVVKCIPLCNVNACKITSILNNAEDKTISGVCIEVERKHVTKPFYQKSLLAGNISVFTWKSTQELLRQHDVI